MKKILIIGFVVGVFLLPTILMAQLYLFPDVEEGDWFYPYVAKIKDWGIIDGNDDGTFAPGNNINRAEFAKMLSLYDERVNEKIEQKCSKNTEEVSIDKTELAELVITKDIQQRTDAWSTRIGITIWVLEGDKQVVITITNSNGESPISNPEVYKDEIQPTIEASMKKFDWLKDYKLTLQIL